MGQDLVGGGGGGVTFECGAGPRLRTLQPEKALGTEPRQGDIQAWGGASA